MPGQEVRFSPVSVPLCLCGEESSMNRADILASLGIGIDNPAASGGDGEWLAGQGAFESANPADGQALARVGRAGAAEYDAVLAGAVAAFLRWREVPAPRRGALVRAIGDALRRHKDTLGSLVSLETGKIKQEGDGEVQEMIDIADFAVGQSRMLYGLTMHSERARHRMYEQWHPLGPVGVVTAFNFPVAVWSWNSFIATVCGDPVIWKPSSLTPLSALAVTHICDQVMAGSGFEGIFGLVVGP